jgi:hypothetical protein
VISRVSNDYLGDYLGDYLRDCLRDYLHDCLSNCLGNCLGDCLGAEVVLVLDVPIIELRILRMHWIGE